jgi:hypothetical protein
MWFPRYVHFQVLDALNIDIDASNRCSTGRHIVEQLLARGENSVSVFDLVQRHFDECVSLSGCAEFDVI